MSPKSSPGLAMILPSLKGARGNAAGRCRGKRAVAFQALSPQYHRKLPGLQNTFTLKISTATYTGKPGISGAEAGGLPVPGQPGLPRETLSPKKPKPTQTVVITAGS